MTGRTKIVDDILIQADNSDIGIPKTREVLQRCRELGITISRKKFEMGESVDFAGFTITDKGVHPDNKHVRSISEFPTPRNIKDVRAFLGLANQLASFVPDLAQNCVNIKKLLEKRNAFVWTEAQENDFQRVKQILTGNLILKPFDIDLPSVLLTDASKLHGLGFALIQIDKDGTKRLVKCGSTGLNDTQRRYAVIELEALALQYALEKCDYFLRGCANITVKTDHKPLKGIWAHDMADIANPRLLRLRLKTTQYNLDIEWTEGKTHYIADALSRYPVFAPDAGSKDLDSCNAYICRRLCDSTPWTTLMHAASEDKEYMSMVIALMDEDFDPESKEIECDGIHYLSRQHMLEMSRKSTVRKWADNF